jgi:antitoxin ParD1/3/4
MAKNTSVNLSDHFKHLIDELVGSGRYGSASEVMREGLRLVEAREARLKALAQALIEGEESSIVGPLDMDEIKRAGRAMRTRAA